MPKIAILLMDFKHSSVELIQREVFRLRSEKYLVYGINDNSTQIDITDALEQGEAHALLSPDASQTSLIPLAYTDLHSPTDIPLDQLAYKKLAIKIFDVDIQRAKYGDGYGLERFSHILGSIYAAERVIDFEKVEGCIIDRLYDGRWHTTKFIFTGGAVNPYRINDYRVNAENATQENGLTRYSIERLVTVNSVEARVALSDNGYNYLSLSAALVCLNEIGLAPDLEGEKLAAARKTEKKNHPVTRQNVSLELSDLKDYSQIADTAGSDNQHAPSFLQKHRLLISMFFFAVVGAVLGALFITGLPLALGIVLGAVGGMSSGLAGSKAYDCFFPPIEENSSTIIMEEAYDVEEPTTPTTDNEQQQIWQRLRVSSPSEYGQTDDETDEEIEEAEDSHLLQRVLVEDVTATEVSDDKGIENSEKHGLKIC
jgi:hypothetical protein